MAKEHNTSPQFTPINLTDDELWDIYRHTPEPRTIRDFHQAIVESGTPCSFAWVKKKVAKNNYIARAALMADPTQDLTVIDVRKVGEFLVKLGKDFDPHKTLKGLQCRVLTVLNQRMNNENIQPEYLEGMMKVYSKMTDELQRTYQHRLEAGEIIPQRDTKPEKGEDVIPFARKGAKQNVPAPN